MSRRTRRCGAARRGALVALAALAPLGAGAAQAAEVEPVLLPAPRWPTPVAGVAAGLQAPRLEVLRSRPNRITDERAWFRRNRLVPAEWAVGDTEVPAPSLPARLRHTVRAAGLVRAIRADDLALLVYAAAPGEGGYLVGADRRTGTPRFAYDFRAYATAPGTPRGEREFAHQAVEWAAVADGTLYVQTAHATYAASSRRRTAYVTAIDLPSSRVRWRSRALVANAASFALVGDLLVTGYGFTGEPDALYALDRRTGRPLRRLALPSAPEHLLFRRGVLFVRTYDRDLVVRVVPARR